jgi:soluble lytic murein transglycosylase-like protein
MKQPAAFARILHLSTQNPCRDLHLATVKPVAVQRMTHRQPGQSGPSDTPSKPLTPPRVAPIAARRRSRRVYLIAPASWKSARSGAHIETMDWSTLVPAPTQWVAKSSPDPLPTVTVRTKHPATHRVSAVARAPATMVATQDLRSLAIAPSRSKAAVTRWLKEHAADRRRVLAAASFCAVTGVVAVLLGMGVAHSQPKPLTSAIAAPLVWQQPPASVAVAPDPTPIVEEVASTPALSTSSADAATTSNTPTSLLSDVSTMDLMMPIAEPDLNIASQQSLWSQVGNESGVDPLLLYSVALVESKSLHPGGEVAPTPWLFRVNDHLILGERHHVQLEMAVASQLGSVVQDVGIMQVYYPMHRDAVRDPLTLLDPKTNISVAAKILRDGMHETRDPVLGVGYYHSHTPELARDYGTAVMTVYQRLKTIYHPARNTHVVAR